MYSLRSNAQYYAMVFGLGLVGLVYVFVSYGVKAEALKSLVMALAYCWGLMLAIYLMGHGLVAIPRRLFRNASISDRLRRLQARAPRVYEQMEDAIMQLEDLEIQVAELGKRSKVGSARDFQDWIEELMDLANLPEPQPVNGHDHGLPRGSGAEAPVLPTVITPKYMADLTRQLMRARHARSRYVGEWNRLLKEATDTQAILDSAASKHLDWGNATPHDTFWQRFTIFTPYTRYLFHYHVAPYLRIVLGCILAFASICIVWSEVVKMALPQLSLIRLSVVHHRTGDDGGQVGFAGQVMAALWICYMCAAALTSVTEVKVWRGRALVRRNTAHESAFWYAGQVAKLTVPLSYNFLTFLGDGVYKKTVFYAFLGRLVVLTDLGKYFDYVFPAFVLVPVLATLFGLYGRVRRAFGFGALDVLDEDEDEAAANPRGYGTGSWREGRDLIERELAGNGPTSRHRYSRYASAAGVLDGGNIRAAPVLSIPRSGPSGSPRPGSPLAGSRVGGPSRTTLSQPRSSPAAGGSRLSSHRPPPSHQHPEPEDDDNFFSVLGHRIRNTVDTLDTPRWLRDFGDGIRKPKWMGGNDDEAGPLGGVGSSNANNNINVGAEFRRWFGGDGGGRIRL